MVSMRQFPLRCYCFSWQSVDSKDLKFSYSKANILERISTLHGFKILWKFLTFNAVKYRLLHFLKVRSEKPKHFVNPLTFHPQYEYSEIQSYRKKKGGQKPWISETPYTVSQKVMQHSSCQSQILCHVADTLWHHGLG